MGAVGELLAAGLWRKLAIGAIICLLPVIVFAGIQTQRLNLAKKEIHNLTIQLEQCQDQIVTMAMVFESMDPQYKGLKDYATKIMEICKQIIRKQDNEENN